MKGAIIEGLAEAVATTAKRLSFHVGDCDAEEIARAVLLSLREQAGDPGIVEAAAKAMAGLYGDDWTEWLDEARAAIPAALSHVLAEGEG